MPETAQYSCDGKWIWMPECKETFFFFKEFKFKFSNFLLSTLQDKAVWIEEYYSSF
jgi:hypothetical protein